MVVDGYDVDSQRNPGQETGEQERADNHLFDPALATNSAVHGTAKEAVDRGANCVDENDGAQQGSASKQKWLVNLKG